MSGQSLLPLMGAGIVAKNLCILGSRRRILVLVYKSRFTCRQNRHDLNDKDLGAGIRSL